MNVVNFNKGKLLYDNYLRLCEENRHSEAEEVLRHSAELSEPMALHALAYNLYQKGGSKCIKRAVALYRKAAQMGLEASAWNLARHYDVMHQPKSYFFWLRRSAELGESDASLELSNPFPFTVSAALEMEGRGLVKEAIKLYRFASKYGNFQAREALSRISIDNYLEQ